MKQKHTVIALVRPKSHQALQDSLLLLALTVCLTESHQVKA